eukprot:3539363-Pyramimonas_sp.AAC.1
MLLEALHTAPNAQPTAVESLAPPCNPRRCQNLTHIAVRPGALNVRGRGLSDSRRSRSWQRSATPRIVGLLFGAFSVSLWRPVLLREVQV